MGAIWSKEAREPSQPSEEADSSQTEYANVEVGSKRTRTNEKAPNPKRPKTTKERREFFKQNNSWKAQSEKGEAVPRPEGPKAPRLQKKKVALMIGFNGTGYQGMQINPNVKTIESELFTAMCEAGAISKDNSDDTKKVQWMRAARTDKGVHAAGNLVSVKMIVPGDDVVEKINSLLPPQIRVWGYIPTMRSFHAKTACDSRVYEYLLPTYAFMPPVAKELTDEPVLPTDLKISGNNNETIRYVSRSTPEELTAKDAYRISSDDLNAFKEALSMFCGTHNFHNYTVGRGYGEKSSSRFIMSIKTAMALLTVRSKTPLSIIANTFESDRINIPKAPALGLLLERPVFSVYNRKIQSNKDQKFRDVIDFDIHKRRAKSMLLNKNGSIRKFLKQKKKNEDFKYLNPEGTIPKEAIIVTKYTASSGDNLDEENAQDED
ncbi:tRNA pseudouridine synthase 1 [Apophysomyces sp. BC1021]|nr:tRNA pseudouridine synthase 1 [Apophysomyces sp. BC1021]